MSSKQQAPTISEKPRQQEGIELGEYIEDAMLQYAILVVSDRAIPDARDGLKPVQRRILTSMELMGLGPKTPHRKCARVVGDVLGKYHPHGDASVYDAMVRLAQPFSLRYPLVDGQGNFGSIDGDTAAAMRYTEARLTPLAEEMMKDFEANTVAWQPNFDDSLKEPTVLPAAIPNLLVNGSSGIAVGVSTNLLPHNLGEVCKAVDYVARNWTKRNQISAGDLMQFIPGPDFPTGGTIFRYRDEGAGRVDTLRRAYETGTSTINGQARIEIAPTTNGRSEIVVTELPYQVQKNTILERVAKDKDTGRFEGLADVRDESDYRGMRLVFETARGANPQDVLARLLTYTQLRTGFSYNAMALLVDENGRKYPKVLSLQEMLVEFIKHRLIIIRRRSIYQREKDSARLHIDEGLLIALEQIEEIIQLVRAAKDTAAAKDVLIKKFKLSETQASAILDMPLRRLANLERKKLEDEAAELRKSIAKMDKLIDSEKERLKVVCEESLSIGETYGDPRRTQILDDVPLTIATVAANAAETPAPSGPRTIKIKTKGGIISETASGKETAGDPTLLQLNLDAQSRVALITDRGQICVTKAADIPDKTSLLNAGLHNNEAIISLQEVKDNTQLAFFTSDGMAKAMKGESLPAGKFGVWKQAIAIEAGTARLSAVLPVKTGTQVFMYTRGSSADETAKGLRFDAQEISVQASYNTKGVTAIKLAKGDQVAGVLAVDEKDVPDVILATTGGFLRRISLNEFSLRSRATQGIAAANTKSGGELVYAGVGAVHHLTLSNGKQVKIAAEKVPTASRAARGTALKSLASVLGGEKIETGHTE
jgi:Type IIA topoisomerase (DNA gyrase/topo II, topoisomerase IV), A subunit